MEDQENMTEASSGVMKTCADCGREVSARATSCPHCGAPLQATIQKCPDCGKDVSIHASSCPNCGRPLEPATRTDIKPVNMGFSLLALPIIVVLCSWASTQDFSFWTGTSLFVFIFAVFIGIEAYRNRKIKEIGHPFFWTVGALFLFPIVYPYYMFKRKEIRLDSFQKWLSIPLALLTLYFWIVSYDQPQVHFDRGDFSGPGLVNDTGSSAGNSVSREEVICRKAKIQITEFLASMEGSKAPSCTSVKLVKKVSDTDWIGQAETSNGKSGEISISIMSFGENDPDPTVVAIPVDLSRFLNPLE